MLELEYVFGSVVKVLIPEINPNSTILREKIGIDNKG